MNIKHNKFKQKIFLGFFFAFLVGLSGMFLPAMSFVKQVEARGARIQPAPRQTIRPAPRRRHYHRHHRHIVVGSYVAVLPAYCSTVTVRSGTYYVCDDVYYRPYYDGGQVVYVVVERP